MPPHLSFAHEKGFKMRHHKGLIPFNRVRIARIFREEVARDSIAYLMWHPRAIRRVASLGRLQIRMPPRALRGWLFRVRRYSLE
jgi:hypothetical protein